MAVVPGVTTNLEHGVVRVQWANVTQADTFGVSQIGTRFLNRSVEVVGTIGGATVLIQGSNGGVTYNTLNSNAGALSFAAAGTKNILENTPYLQPSHSGGSGESITVTIVGTAQR